MYGSLNGDSGHSKSSIRYFRSNLDELLAFDGYLYVLASVFVEIGQSTMDERLELRYCLDFGTGNRPLLGANWRVFLWGNLFMKTVRLIPAADLEIPHQFSCIALSPESFLKRA